MFFDDEITKNEFYNITNYHILNFSCVVSLVIDKQALNLESVYIANTKKILHRLIRNSKKKLIQ